MDNDNLVPTYRNCNWIWDEIFNTITCAPDINSPKSMSQTAILKGQTKSVLFGSTNIDMKFRDNIDMLEQIRFKRHFQRRIRVNEPDIVTLQDVKDVVLFLNDRKSVTEEFLDYYHLPTVDRFFRCLIVYFQTYLDTWERVLLRREEATRKLTQPMVTVLENIVRDNLSDIRSILAREYSFLVLGWEGCHIFHHMSSRERSISDKDRRLFEVLIRMAARVVWIALNRHNLRLIEIELNRLLRTKTFYGTACLHGSAYLSTPAEDRVLYGEADVEEPKLKQKSPMVKELIFGSHDHRILASGITKFEPQDERALYLEAACFAPEEELANLKILVGILGRPRSEFDAMLVAKDTKKEKTQIEFKLPKTSSDRYENMPSSYPKVIPRYPQIRKRSYAAKKQQAMWKDKIAKKKETDIKDEKDAFSCMSDILTFSSSVYGGYSS